VLDTVRLYVDATVAVALMTTFGIVAGFVAAAMTGNHMHIVLAAGAAFALTGVALTVRLWRMTRRPAPPAPAV